MKSYNEYWMDEKQYSKHSNKPENYGCKELINRGLNLSKQIELLNLEKNAKILELGCNLGRNLEFLRMQGFTDLTGIDINENAFNLGKENYPDLYRILKFHIGKCGNILENLNEKYDLVYTMAFLMHVDNDERKKIYEWLKLHARYIICIEPFNDNSPSKIMDGRLFNKIDIQEFSNFKIINKIENVKKLSKLYINYLFKNELIQS